MCEADEGRISIDEWNEKMMGMDWGTLCEGMRVGDVALCFDFLGVLLGVLLLGNVAAGGILDTGRKRESGEESREDVNEHGEKMRCEDTRWENVAAFRFY